MEKKMNNEELQNRREFFKKAAKGALPILGAIVLSQSTLLAKADVPTTGCNGCVGQCMRGCKNGCSGGCGSSCNMSCQGKTWTSGGRDCDKCLSMCWGCSGQCYSSCQGSCKNGSNGTY